MFTRDFILRQIHQLTQVLARVMLLKSEQRTAEAFQEIHRAFSGTPGLEPLLRLDLTREDVLEPCISESGFSTDLGLALADLLWEKGLLIRGSDRSGCCSVPTICPMALRNRRRPGKRHGAPGSAPADRLAA